MRYQSWLQWLMASGEMLQMLALLLMTLLACLLAFSILLVWWLVSFPFVGFWRLIRG